MTTACPKCSAELDLEDVRKLIDEFKLKIEDFPVLSTQDELNRTEARQRKADAKLLAIIATAGRKMVHKNHLTVEKRGDNWLLIHPPTGKAWDVIRLDPDLYDFDFREIIHQ